MVYLYGEMKYNHNMNNQENNFTDINQQIFELLKEKPGLKAREIATHLDIDKKTVNSALYGYLKNKCIQDEKYCWYSSKNIPKENNDKKTVIPKTALSNLSRYYLACLAEDVGGRFSIFTNSNHGLDYYELDSLPRSEKEIEKVFTSSIVQGFLNETRRDNSKKVYFGYPLMVKHIYSSRSNWSGFKAAPIFLFPINIENNKSNIDFNSPIINRQVIEYFTNSKGEAFITELVNIEEELGLSGNKEIPELDEIVLRLKKIRPHWAWIEDIDPFNLKLDPSLASNKKEGILNRALIFKNKEAPNNFTKGLEYELNQLTKISKDDYCDTVLGHWIRREIINQDNYLNKSLLEVFPMNLEQRQAVEKSLTKKLTVITGPPGTGKSQVVSNILINAAWQGKKVLFTSKNNKAVDVVENRINNINTRPVLLRLGSKNEYQDRLISHISNFITTTIDDQERIDFESRNKEYESLREKLSQIDNDIDSLVSLRNKVDKIDRGIKEDNFAFSKDFILQIKSLNNDFEEQVKKIKYFAENIFFEKNSLWKEIFFFFRKKKYYRDFLEALKEIEYIFEELDIPNFPNKINSRKISEYGSVWKSVYSDIENILKYKSYFDSLNELQRNRTLEDLTKDRLEIIKKMSKKSDTLWRLFLKLQSADLSREDRSALSQYKTTLQMVSRDNPSSSVWKSYFEQSQKISHILPLWAITSLSAKGRIPFKGEVYDIVVFDESSQCDIASALPLLYRAKQVVIIGDPKQLSHISAISKKQDERLLEKYSLLGSFNDWAYSYNSLFDLAASLCEKNDIINLRDHYRSHADIINFSNETFYEGRLRIATPYNSLKIPLREKVGIRWVDVKSNAMAAPSRSGSQNIREAEVVVEELERLMKQDYQGSIGAVSPFRSQANLIREKINNNEPLQRWLDRKYFLVDTVHKFQGDEKDLIFFSPVVAKGITKGSINFLKKTGNLFNVAITRARAMLIVVGNHEAVLNSEIDHMRSFAYYIHNLSNQKEEDGNLILNKSYPTVANPERVSEWEKILYEKLYDRGIKTIPQYQEEMYTLDFALFQGERKLNIEVDGEHYHKDWTGELCYRDQIRNQRLIENGWDVIRFWVYEVRDDIDGCVEKIKQWTKELNK
jgi:very-short-patch-repair endonuclease